MQNCLLGNDLYNRSETNFSWTLAQTLSATVISNYHCEAALKRSVLLKALYKWCDWPTCLMLWMKR